MDGVRIIRSEKLGEHQYARPIEKKRVEWDGKNDVEHVWEQVKRAIAESAKELFDSEIMGGKNQKNMECNDKVKAVIRRKEVVWKGVFGATNEEIKERCMELYREEKSKVKRYII